MTKGRWQKEERVGGPDRDVGVCHRFVDARIARAVSGSSGPPPYPPCQGGEPERAAAPYEPEARASACLDHEGFVLLPPLIMGDSFLFTSLIMGDSFLFPP